jgi:hypothetical protein
MFLEESECKEQAEKRIHRLRVQKNLTFYQEELFVAREWAVFYERL